ncbi:PepSY domain-containing protein [Bradyrhizobium jicamae]|uniref:PepSY domain-containing protein n=1 Tax=Bradyrhizobium jicamae TaxID=280332 RepID=UPI001BA979E2|nr:PepSY domain-containing protein [Bradyrhizobium jicamae]MBR0757929.1 PepSY domain-containing protein [Bradyrhizobium jicamae]
MTTRQRSKPGQRWFAARLFAAALLSLPFTAPSGANAISGTVAATLHSPTDEDAGLDAQAVRRELDNFRAAQISLARAMAIAEGLHTGSTTADVSFDGAAAPPVYRIKTVQHDRIWRNAIDAATGAVLDSEAASPLATLDAEDRSNLVVLKALRHRLSDAVRVAEHTTSGKAISGGLTRERGKLSFVIVVLSGADLKQVVLEPPGARGR